jgi:hypothetical protein
MSLKPRRHKLCGHLTGRLKKLQDLVADQLTNEVAAVEEEEYAAQTAGIAAMTKTKTDYLAPVFSNAVL